MTQYACYTFIGTDGSMGLKRGCRYNLAVYKMNLISRALSVYPYSWKVIAFRPFQLGSPIMPYSSQNAFDDNWRKVDSISHKS